jgi:hypothetical protein
MLHLDSLNNATTQAVRKLSKLETFGVNSVEVYPNGTVFMNGYFSLNELQLLSEIAKKLGGDKPAQ